MISSVNKIIGALTSQIRKGSVTIPAEVMPHKITDDNQSIKNGVIHEKLNISVRSQASHPRKCK